MPVRERAASAVLALCAVSPHDRVRQRRLWAARQAARRARDVTASQRVARHDLDARNKAAAIPSKGGDRAYDRALRALLPDSREWWESYLEEEEYTPDAEGLASFITEHLSPLCYQQEKRVSPPRCHREPNHWRRVASLQTGEAFPLRNALGPQV